MAPSEPLQQDRRSELLTREGVETYKRERPKFMQRLVAKQRNRAK